MILSLAGEEDRGLEARRFCRDFLAPDGPPRYVFGRNVYGEAIARHAPITGFVDDLTTDTSFLDLPVVRTGDIPAESLVLAASSGRPLTVRRHLRAAGFRNLDYFAFHKHAGLPLTDIVFNEGFAAEFALNRSRYARVLDMLADDESKMVFRKLVSFRLKGDLDLLDGFAAREAEQYFEPFLDLSSDGEVFVDVGGYDGFTASQFIRCCPGHAAVHVFEPEARNFETCSARLGHLPRVAIHKLGLSDLSRSLSFDPQGSASPISRQGQDVIRVVRLDDVVAGPVTFIKMDIEGAEPDAIHGARRTIADNHPRLAIAAYHGAGPLWTLPEHVLGIRSDYKIFLRHYTESIYETIMFFIPVR